MVLGCGRIESRYICGESYRGEGGFSMIEVGSITGDSTGNTLEFDSAQRQDMSGMG